MGTDETYQGWTNRETWALMLHINNDEGLSEMFRQLVRMDGGAGQDWEREERVRDYATALLNPDEYREEYGEPQGVELRRMASEVGSLWRVNWQEVVEALTEE